MLRELLQMVETAEGPLTLAELSHRLEIDLSALDGMLQHWVHKGRLVVDSGMTMACTGSPSTATCGFGSCSGEGGCPFIARLPRSYVVVREKEGTQS